MQVASRPLLLSLAMLAILSPSALGRIWTEGSGNFSVEAEFVAVRGDSVTLKKPDGSVIKVPMASLSESDKQFIARRGAAPPEDDKDAKRRHEEVDELIFGALHLLEAGQGDLAQEEARGSEPGRPGGHPRGLPCGAAVRIAGADWKSAEKYFSRCCHRNPAHAGAEQSCAGGRSPAQV